MKCEKCGEEHKTTRGRKFDTWVHELYLCSGCERWLYNYIINEVLEYVNINENEEEEETNAKEEDK